MNMTALIAFTFSYPERMKNMTALTDTRCLIFVKDEEHDCFDCCHFLVFKEDFEYDCLG